MSEDFTRKIIQFDFTKLESEQKEHTQKFPLTESEIKELFQRVIYMRSELMDSIPHEGRLQEQLTRLQGLDLQGITTEIMRSQPGNWKAQPSRFRALLYLLDADTMGQEMRSWWIGHLREKTKQAEAEERRKDAAAEEEKDKK